MESNINLESFRELSESQLEALLRYDSPPETPIQPTDPLILNGPSFQKDLNINKNDNSFNCFNHNNREQFSSQIDSQIDFSIFNRYSPSGQWSFSPLNVQINENEHSIIVASPLNTAENPIASIQDNEESNFEEDFFIELDKNQNTSATKNCNLVAKQGIADHFNETNCSHRKQYEFGKIDNIFKKIEYISNLEVSHMNEVNSPNCVQRKTFFQENVMEFNSVNSPSPSLSFGEIICPNIAEMNNIFEKTQPGHILDDQRSSRKEENVIEFNSVNSSNILQREDENKNNEDTPSPCLSFNENIYANIVKMDDIFEKTQTDHILDAPNSGQKQSQVETEINSPLSLFDEDKSKTNTTPSSSKNINLQMDASSIPFSVKQLYDIVKTNYSDFAFIYALSSQLCQDRVPMECFVTLKMALLLSLVSVGNNENRPPIPIVAVTNDTYMTDYLMTNIGQLGSRFLGPMDEMKSCSDINWIEADSILLARGGVYYAGDWTRLKLRRADSILKNIECSSVAVEKSNLSFPLETAIWTHWRSFKYGAKDQQTFNKFLKIFGIPIFVSDDNHDALIDYTLEQSSIRVFESTVDHLSVSEDDMRNFLVYVSQNDVDLSTEAAILLKNYFVASRSIKQDCLSKQSYSMLKQFAESFAKLSMRKVVLTDDALAAIILCEHFVENVFSSSSNSPPHFGDFTFVGTVDKYMAEFKEWLDSYIEKFTKE